MIFPEIVRLARTLTDAPRAIVERHAFIRGLGNASCSYDLSEEQRINKLAQRYKQQKKSGFHLLSVDDGILEPTCIKRNFRRIGKTEIPKPTIIFGDKPIDLRDKHYGCLDSFGEVPEIIYGSWMTVCWKRFVVAKELLHLYSGTDQDDDTKDADDLINAARDSCLNIPDENTELSDEASGLYLAIEVVLPWRLREQYIWLRENNATDWQIAKVFMIPSEIVGFISSARCADGTTYFELSKRVNENNV